MATAKILKLNSLDKLMSVCGYVLFFHISSSWNFCSVVKNPDFSWVTVSEKELRLGQVATVSPASNMIFLFIWATEFWEIKLSVMTEIVVGLVFVLTFISLFKFGFMDFVCILVTYLVNRLFDDFWVQNVITWPK